MKKQGNNKESQANKPIKSDGRWSLKRFFCPCLMPTAKNSPLRLQRESFEPVQHVDSLPSSIRSSDKKSKKSATHLDSNQTKPQRPTYVFPKQHDLKRETLLNKKAIHIEQYSQIMQREERHHRRSAGNLKVDFPICGLSDKELISVGINDRHLLVKIANIHLSPNPAALKKELAHGKSNRQTRAKQTQHTNNIDRFWVQRYALFQRFDQGIKLDEPSWVRTPPGPICEWIGGKCSQAKLIVDAFAGVGGTTIRIANGPQCLKVIANDWNGTRLQCLHNNCKVYDVDRSIELREGNFLQFQQKGVEVVFAQPPIDKELRTTLNSCLSIVDFEPTLDKIISKSLKLSNNMILLLPPAISIDVLCSCINKCATQLGKMKNTCSAKLEKIYYQGQIKYILLTMGRCVQDQIKLSHELNFIYAKLQQPQKTPFYHKKLIKYIREQYGMIFLLNLVKECEKKFKQQPKKQNQIIFDIFLEIIKDRTLIPYERFSKLMAEHETSMEKKRKGLDQSGDKSFDKSFEKSFDKSFDNRSDRKQSQQILPMESIMEQQKVNQEVFPSYRMSEQTQSEESHYSYLSGLQKPPGSSRTPRAFAQSFGSIVIKRTLNESRQNRSISPSSRRQMTPSKKTKERNSQIIIIQEKDSPKQIQRGSHIVAPKKYVNQRK